MTLFWGSAGGCPHWLFWKGDIGACPHCGSRYWPLPYDVCGDDPAQGGCPRLAELEDCATGIDAPQVVQITRLGGSGAPQRWQRFTGGPPYGGYIEDI